MSKQRARGARFNDLVHVGRIYIGGKTREKARTPKVAIDKIVGRLTALGGGATAFRARGVYRSEAQPFVSEPSTVVETFVPLSTSCKKFKRQMKDIGQRAAKEGLQESVGVVVQCAGQATDAVFATQRLRKRRF